MSGDESNLNFEKPVEDIYLSSFKMRCPDCFKSYTVDWADIHEVEPKFKCSGCATTFSIEVTKAFSEKRELIGFKLESASAGLDFEENSSDVDASESEKKRSVDAGVGIYKNAPPVQLEPQVERPAAKVRVPNPTLFNCPKCAEPYAAGAIDCKKCGVIFLKIAEKKIKELTKVEDLTGITASDELKDAWENVLLHYEDEKLHGEFVQLAWRDSGLDYAAKKYANILDVVPRDEIAEKYKNRVLNLTNLKFEITEVENQNPVRRWFNRQDVGELAKTNIRKLKITNVIMFVSGILIVIGMANPALRNLIGFGAAVLSFILALRFYFRVI